MGEIQHGGKDPKAKKSKQHDHKYKRWVVECSLILKLEGLDKYPEFSHALKMLLKNGQKVDPSLVIETVTVGKGEEIDIPEDVPMNFTDLSTNVKVSGRGQGV